MMRRERRGQPFLRIRFFKKEAEIGYALKKTDLPETCAANDFEYCWENSPYRIVVGNNPVNKVDPFGLHTYVNQGTTADGRTIYWVFDDNGNYTGTVYGEPLPEIPNWVCTMGIKQGCNILCKKVIGKFTVCQSLCTQMAALACPKKCE